MKRYRDPTPALQRPEPDLPLTQKLLCAIVVMIVVSAIVWAVWFSVHLEHSTR